MSLREIQSRKQQRQQQSSISPLHILITGSSQGIGLAAAQRLIQDGHIVYHACRSEERAQEAVGAAGGGVALKGCCCDLADLDSIKQYAQKVQNEIPRLDILCLNAAYSPSGSAATKPPLLTKQGFEGGIGISHLGHFLLAQLLIPKLAQDGGGRLVITASSVHDPEERAGKSGGGKTASLGDLSGLGINLKVNPNGPTMIDGCVEYFGTKVYKDSKLCNILMCRQATKRLPTNIQTVSFNPGFVPSTSLFDSLRKESWWKAQALMLFANLMGMSVPLQVAGDRLVYMATAPKTLIPNGSYYCAPSKCQGTTPETGFVEKTPSKEARNEQVAAKLWDKSLEIVKPWL